MGQLRRRVEAYFHACNDGSPEAIAANFTEDGCIYDLNVKPVRGREAIARLGSDMRQMGWAELDDRQHGRG